MRTIYLCMIIEKAYFLEIYSIQLEKQGGSDSCK